MGSFLSDCGDAELNFGVRGEGRTGGQSPRVVAPQEDLMAVGVTKRGSQKSLLGVRDPCWLTAADGVSSASSCPLTCEMELSQGCHGVSVASCV